MEIAVNVLIALAIVVFVGYPLFARKEVLPALVGQDEEDIEIEKESVYAAIKDLDFDYRTGKISEEDYQDLREQFKGEAVALLKEAEERVHEEEDVLETEIKSHRKSGLKEADKARGLSSTGICSNCGAPYGGKDKFCARCGQSLDELELVCPKCARPFRKGDKFCENCGTKL